MKMKDKQLSTFILMALFCNNIYAGKYDVLLGMYSYNAKVSDKKTSFSGFGTYEASYLHPISNNFELNLGYSFTMTNVVGGDYSYGPKLGFNYYPVNFASNEKIELPNKIIQIYDFYKPYLGFAFNQRQFQSARTSYAGFGISLGCEKYINKSYTFKGEVKMNSYTGASDATASEVNLLVGLVMGF